MEDSFEIVPNNVSKKDVIDEAHRRAAKFGYCTKNGDPPWRTKIQTTVPFGRTKLNLWPRDKHGRLIGE